MITFDFGGQEPREKIKLNPEFEFKKIKADLAVVKRFRHDYQGQKKMIVIGRGGSVSTFRALWEGLGKFQMGNEEVYILDTLDPDFIDFVKTRFSPADSLVVAVSKSGNTVEVIESLDSFKGYETIVITGEAEPNQLRQIAQEEGFEIISHPEIGGRFSGLTAVSLIPAAIAGLDAAAIVNGGVEGYQRFTKPGNEAENLARIIYDHYQKGASEIYWALYSKKMASFEELITQLIHESLAKDNHGLTVVVSEGPESQHHSSQRLFGGPENMFAIFSTVRKFDHDHKTEKGYLLSEAMKFELEGTFREAKRRGIPAVGMELEKATEESFGQFIAFLHCFVVYLATLLQVNPYDQPQVENSKRISLALRRNDQQKSF